GVGRVHPGRLRPRRAGGGDARGAAAGRIHSNHRERVVDDLPGGAAGEGARRGPVLESGTHNMKTKVLVAAAVLLNAMSVFAGPRISFVRSLPATYDLAPAELLVFIYAIGDSDQVTDFVGDFVDAVGRSGAYRIENASENNHHLPVDD